MTRQRMQYGKIEEAKQGKFVNGRPPLGYIYNPQLKEVEIDESVRYRYIVDKVLSVEYSAYSIVFKKISRVYELNIMVSGTIQEGAVFYYRSFNYFCYV